MQKNRNELIQYLNSCHNCYGTVINTFGKPEVVYIDSWHFFDNKMMITISDDKIEVLHDTQGSTIAFAIWNKLEGYQVKGNMIDSSESLVIAITDIYSVTPGKQAGEILDII